MQPKILVLNPGKPFYEEVVTACGAEAVCQMYPEVSTDYDGLLLCGGGDIEPLRYGQENFDSKNTVPQRDENEMELAMAFTKAGKPILGICRGMQLLNVVFGGDLYQHIPTAEAHSAPGDAVHAVTAVGESYLSNIYGKHFAVNSVHHQSVNKLAEGFRVTLVSDSDGVVEAIEHKDLPIFGVQWHPERICLSKVREDAVDGLGVIQHFVDLCKK